MPIKMWPKDAKGFGERLSYVLMYLAPLAGFLYMWLSAAQVIKGAYQEACSNAGTVSIVFGVILTAIGAGGIIYLGIKGTAERGQIILFLALMAIALLVFGASGL